MRTDPRVGTAGNPFGPKVVTHVAAYILLPMSPGLDLELWARPEGIEPRTSALEVVVSI